MNVTITLSTYDWSEIVGFLISCQLNCVLTSREEAELNDYIETIQEKLPPLPRQLSKPRADSLQDRRMPLVCSCSECSRSPDPCDWTGGL